MHSLRSRCERWHLVERERVKLERAFSPLLPPVSNRVFIMLSSRSFPVWQSSLWIGLSLLSATGQALGWALKKKVLSDSQVNNILGCISFFAAGIILLLMWGFTASWHVPLLTTRFVVASVVVIILNVIAFWAAYKALDVSDFSALMPFISLTALTIVPIELVLRGVLPTGLQIIGMTFVIIGSLIFHLRTLPTATSRRAIAYFGVTLVCFSITSPLGAVVVDECGSGLFAAMTFHIGIGFGFIPLLLTSNQRKVVREFLHRRDLWKLTGFMVVSGIVLAALENGPATVALQYADASEVFALKRTMPLFSLLLGRFLFREQITLRKITGTLLLVAGSFVVIWFQ
jgi:drug/metabolite transporter (DMT)-like permease